MEITINEKNAQAAYDAADEQGKKMLTALFGTAFQPADNRPITERVKSYEDACKVLGVEPQTYDDEEVDIAAFKKLRTIAKALNEGWLPQFTRGEFRYYPWFEFYGKDKIVNMSEEEKRRIAARSYCSTFTRGGVGCVYTYNDSSDTYAHYGSRLALKSSTLAQYMGEQFIVIWADYIGY